MIISEHLSLPELIRSDSAKRLGITNMPTAEHIINLKALAENIFEPIRAHFRCPIFIGPRSLTRLCLVPNQANISKVRQLILIWMAHQMV